METSISLGYSSAIPPDQFPSLSRHPSDNYRFFLLARQIRRVGDRNRKLNKSRGRERDRIGERERERERGSIRSDGVRLLPSSRPHCRCTCSPCTDFRFHLLCVFAEILRFQATEERSAWLTGLKSNVRQFIRLENRE